LDIIITLSKFLILHQIQCNRVQNITPFIHSTTQNLGTFISWDVKTERIISQRHCFVRTATASYHDVSPG